MVPEKKYGDYNIISFLSILFKKNAYIIGECKGKH